VIEAGAEALLTLLRPVNLGFMLVGVSAGMAVGILPGLGGTVGLSLLLPFVFGMEAEQAIALLIGMAAVVHTADTFPSVLLGVPGSSGSQATIMDGYPLARRGEAGRALGAAFSASLVGGLVGAVTLFLILPIARPIVLAFGSPELFMLALLGLSIVGILSGSHPIRGVLMALLGLLLGAVGAAPATPFYRFTFDQLYLYDGIPLAVLALGLFALPELLDLLATGTRIADVADVDARGWRTGVRDVIREKALVFRSSVLGVGVGFIPGLGGAVVDWLSYGIAAQTSKGGEGFGKGDIRGVIAPESSNNAKEGGALIPTLLFGIPGSGTTAILLGGLILLGLQPGPRMVRDELPLTLVVVWTLALANVFGTLACLSLSGFVARISRVPPAILAPFLLVVMMAGAFQSSRSWGDLVTFVVVGFLGWVLRRLDYPLPPILIGFVLAASIERNLFISVSRYGWDWLLSPAVIGIGLVTIMLTALGVRLNRKRLV
jgi:putative tricarboxylic transport membrane protein